MRFDEGARGRHLFRVSIHAGIWCVLCNGAFLSNYETKADANDAAEAAARKAEASGHAVEVFTA